MGLTRATVGALACWCLVVVHVVAALDIVFGQRIGPVVAVIDEGAGHGVHAGDMLALPILLSAVACFVGAIGFASAGMHRRTALPWRTVTAA